MNLTPEQIQQNADAVKAHLQHNPAPIEYSTDGGKTWHITETPTWSFGTNLYRPKPEPKTRPWDFTSRPREVVWVYKKGFISDRMITVWKDDCVEVGSYAAVKYDTLLSEWLQRDGSPCGITEP